MITAFLSDLADIFLLMLIGSFGWMIFRFLRIPSASIIGPIVILVSVGAFDVALPYSPNWFASIIQILLGYFIGSMIKKNDFKAIKNLFTPFLIIIAWVLLTFLLLSFILFRLTELDLVTAILASSLGGLPEMSVFAMSTGADLPIVISLLACRMFITVIIYPFILKILSKRMENSKGERFIDDLTSGNRNTFEMFSISNVIVSLTAAVLTGYLFKTIGIPAGEMVGAMVGTLICSISGLRVYRFSGKIYDIVMVGVAILVANSITDATLGFIFSSYFIGPLIITVLFLFISSLSLAYLFARVFKWDLPTSILVVAPGGFSVVIGLALQYKADPFRVSLLHICRLISTKFIVALMLFLI